MAGEVASFTGIMDVVLVLKISQMRGDMASGKGHRDTTVILLHTKVGITRVR